MGTFIGYYGDPKIPKVKREEFTERVMKIFDQGGMMYRDCIRIFDKELTLLTPYHTTENGVFCVDFNYFEDDSWETAGFDPKTAKIFTNKVGCHEFNAVMRTLYVLSEFYSEPPCIAEMDGKPFHASLHIGWLNFLFGEKYTNERDTNLWKTGQLLPEVCNHHEICDKDIVPLIPLPPVETTNFLDEAHYIHFFESIGENFYRLHDDDRIWWWREDGDVHLSIETWDWLQTLHKEWQSILKSGAKKSVADVQKLWIDTLAEADEVYHNMYSFRDCFYEFLTQAENPEVQAAIILLKRLVNRNRQEMIDQTGEDFMDLIMSLGAKVRRDMKRYLAFLDNRCLRQKIFGF